jgi:flagellar basal-body rod modification protein FlgD
MTVSPLTSASSAAPPATPAVNPASSISNTQFIQLLATQLQHQDPTAPTDPGQILQQTATIAQMQAETNMTSAVQQSEATALIGKTVQGSAGGQQVTGVVSDIQVDPSTGTPTVLINGVAVDLSAITDISATAPSSSSATPTAATS